MCADHTAVSSRPRVVIIGAGFGGLNAAHALRAAPVQVTVIDRRNHHLFQPLLYQVATAGLSPAEIAAPVRSILRRQKNARVLLGEVTQIDLQHRQVCVGEHREHFDFLIVATGARHGYFGHDEWERYAPGLKTLEDAIEIRRRILLAFERAEMSLDTSERNRLLTFVIVGGGPTGVELAGTLSELARKALAADFRHIDTRMTRVILAEAGPQVLPAFPASLSERAKKSLTDLGVEVRLGVAVTQVDELGVLLGTERIHAATVLWAAGVAASTAAKLLGAAQDRAGRTLVEPDLSVPGHPEVFVIGDTAHVSGTDGKPLPGIATVAKQQGRYLGRLIRARVQNQSTSEKFRYRNPGNLATIGRRAAVVDFGWLRMSGWIAWFIWCAAHIFFLIGFRNRLVVALDWIISYITFGRGARLITGSGRDER